MAGYSVPYQFIGYWGWGDRDRLDNCLTKLEIIASIQRGSLAENSGIWSIGKSSNTTSISEGDAIAKCDASRIASISAAGLTDPPDAWVKVRDNSLILGREPFGKVPLYWTKQETVIWFASHLSLLLEIRENYRVSIRGLYGYCCFSYVPTPLTPVEGVFAVPAGVELTWHYTDLVADLAADGLTDGVADLAADLAADGVADEVADLAADGVTDGVADEVADGVADRKDFPMPYVLCPIPHSQTQYQWREAKVLIKDETAAIAQLQTLLKNAVRRQISDLKNETVGVFLSGGLDSSTVAALLVKSGVNVRAYSLDFGIEAISELPHAERVADFLNIPLVKVLATPKQIKKAIAPTAKALDLPFGDGVTVPLYLLCQAASRDVRIIFNGEGGDQLFAGWTNKPLIAAGVYNTFHPTGGEDFTQQYLRTFHRLYSYEAQVFSANVCERVKDINPQDWLRSALDSTYCTSLLHRFRRAGLILKGAQNIHPRATNLALAHGLVVRSPFCDLPLAEWTFQLSGELCLRGNCEKYLLKRAVESWLPPEIVWREKRGMGVPSTLWCLNELWQEVGKWLNPGRVRSAGRFVPDIAIKVIRGRLGGQIRSRRIGEILWLLMMWQVWRTQVLQEAATKQALFSPFLLPSWWWKLLDRWQRLED